MANENSETESNKKKIYIKPEATKVFLRSEEAVLGGCKMSTGGGVGSPSDCTLCSTSAS